VRVACPVDPESAALGAALQTAAVDAGAGAALGEWITEHHDPPVSARWSSQDAQRAAALEDAYAVYAARAGALFACGAI
jgi:hypothetical protein